MSLYELFHYAQVPLSWKNVIEVVARWESSEITEWGEKWDGGWLIRMRRYNYQKNRHEGEYLAHIRAWRDWSAIWTDEMGSNIEYLEEGSEWPRGYDWQALNLIVQES